MTEQQTEHDLPLTGTVTTIDTIEQRVDGKWQKQSRQTKVVEFRGDVPK